jgi:hypothetical protein
VRALVRSECRLREHATYQVKRCAMQTVTLSRHDWQRTECLVSAGVDGVVEGDRSAPRARISSQCPSSMIMISRASSHQKSRSKPPKSSAVAPGGDEGDADRHRDQQHHPRLPGPGFADRALRNGRPP